MTPFPREELRTWLASITGLSLPAIVYTDEPEAMTTGVGRLRVSFTSDEVAAIEDEWTSDPSPGNPGIAIVTTREVDYISLSLTFELQAPATTSFASDVLRRVRTKVWQLAYIYSLRAIGLAIVDVGTIRRLSGPIVEGRTMPVGQLDLRVAFYNTDTIAQNEMSTDFIRTVNADIGLGLGLVSVDGGGLIGVPIVVGLKLWLRGDLGKTIATGVSAWADQSGNGNNVVQATASKQPTVNTSDGAYNGQTTLGFAQSSLQCMQGAFAAGITQNYTVFLVGSTNRLSSQAMFDSNATDGGRCECYFDSTSNQVYGGTFLSTPDTSTAPRVLVYEMAGASSKIYVSALTAATTGNAGVNSLSGATIGAAYDLTSYCHDGKIAEVLVYSTPPNATDRTAITQYLGTRYGITIGA